MTKEEEKAVVSEPTEQLYGIMALRKIQVAGDERWIVTCGPQCVSSKSHITKELAMKEVEEMNLETICRIIVGATMGITDHKIRTLKQELNYES